MNDTKLKRYDPVWYSTMSKEAQRGNASDMEEYEDGDWVRYSDVAPLLDRAEVVEAAKNLVAQKGRHNTGLAYDRLVQALAALNNPTP